MHSKQPLGACIVQVDRPEDANEKTKQLGLMPNECNKAFGYVLSDEDFAEQDMELNKFYDTDDMNRLGFQKASTARKKMNMSRWTIKELEQASNRHILLTLVYKRMERLSPEAPLHKRLTAIADDLRRFRDDVQTLELKPSQANRPKAGQKGR